MENYGLISFLGWMICGGFNFHYFYLNSGAADDMVKENVVQSKLGVLLFCLLTGPTMLAYNIVSDIYREYSPKRYKKLYLHDFSQRDEITVKVINYYEWVSKSFKQSKTTTIDADVLASNFEYFKPKEGENPLAAKTKVMDYYLYLQQFDPDLFKLTDHTNYLKDVV